MVDDPKPAWELDVWVVNNLIINMYLFVQEFKVLVLATFAFKCYVDPLWHLQLNKQFWLQDGIMINLIQLAVANHNDCLFKFHNQFR